MRLVLLPILAALIAASPPRSASAQTIPLSSFEEEPSKLVEVAFVTQYGRLLLAEFADVVTESAESTCLKTKKIDAESLPGRARAIALRQGAEFMKRFMSAVNRDAFNVALTTRAGTNARTELAKLREHPDVRAFVELSAISQKAGIANSIMELLDRNILTLRIKMARPFHPLASGNLKLAEADPSDSINDKLDKLIAQNTSAALARYVELVDAMQESLKKSFDAKALFGVHNVDFTPDLERDLAEVCVLRRQ